MLGAPEGVGAERSHPPPEGGADRRGTTAPGRAWLRRALLPTRVLLALGRSAARRPGHFLAVAALLALITGAAGLSATHLWVGYHRRAARRALEKYHNAEAQRHLLQCLRVQPSDPDTLLLAARTARRADALEDAERLLDRYQERRGADEALVLERMLLLAQRGEFDSVEEFCQARVREDHPSTPLILEALVQGLIRMYRLGEAELWLAEWLKRQPDNTQALLFQGLIHELRQNRAGSLEAYRRVVELDAGHDDARLRLAGVLLDMNKPADALPHLEYLSRRHPDDADVLTRLARCQDLLGQPEKAERTLEGVLDRDPHYAPAVAERGKLARRLGDLERAEAWLREAVALEPGNYGTHYQLYLCLTARKKPEEAREAHERMQRVEEDLKRIAQIVTEEMQRRPRDPDLCYEVAMIALRTGSPGEVLRWLKQAVRLDPHHAASHKALATYYQRMGNPGLAARHRELAGRAEGRAPRGGT
jgi:tetratricopeptide (TPR) repeat protein